jgi:hypothetical protein
MTNPNAAPGPAQTIKPPPGTRVIADVFARNGVGEAIDYSVEWRWENGDPGGSGAIEVPEKKKGEKGTPIDFHLHDETQPHRGLVFTDDVKGPIWIQLESCPTDQCLDGQFPADQIKRTDKLLSVVDDNSVKGDLHYRLRFRDKDGNPDSYDPEIKNGGST